MSDEQKTYEQEFYCKICKKSFKAKNPEHYWNFPCNECGTISEIKGSLGNIFKGLPTIKR